MHTKRATRAAVAARLIPAIVVLILGFALLGCTTTNPGPSLDRNVDHMWSRDIEVMFDTLPGKHKNLFFQLPEAEYRKRLVELNERAADLSAPEFEIALRRILAEVGDAHTNVSFAHDSLFPLHFQAFAEGIFVVAATPGYKEYIGARLEQVENTTVEEYLAKAREITPHDNASQLKRWTPVYLTIPTVLAGLDITESQSKVTYTLVDQERSVAQRVSLPAVRRESVSQLISIRDRVEDRGVSQPVSRQNTEAIYRHEYLAEHETVYVQYNSCMEDDSYPMQHFVDDVFATVEGEEANVMIVDLRRNSGGDSRVLQPFIDAVVEWVGAAESDTGAERELYVLLGRNTFSSAVLNAIALRQEAGAVFVGEPSGGRPNHYGEIKSIELPDLGRRLTYSTKYFNLYEAADPQTLMPDIEVPNSYRAYLEGRDLILEAALESDPARLSN